jgi:hypothetical protein
LHGPYVTTAGVLKESPSGRTVTLRDDDRLQHVKRIKGAPEKGSRAESDPLVGSPKSKPRGLDSSLHCGAHGETINVTTKNPLTHRVPTRSGGVAETRSHPGRSVFAALDDAELEETTVCSNRNISGEHDRQVSSEDRLDASKATVGQLLERTVGYTD